MGRRNKKINFTELQFLNVRDEDKEVKGSKPWIEPAATPSINRSPCLSCNIHLEGLDKESVEACEECEKLAKYRRNTCGPTSIEEIEDF